MPFDLFQSNETLSPMALPLPSGHTRRLIADGPKGTAQTIDVMQRMVNSYKTNNNVRRVCGEAISSCAPKDYYNYCKKCYEWVRDNIKYAYDPHLKEFCESPEKLLENRIGDCDSQDMLLASMFENLGFPAQFVTIKADPSRPDEYTHVFTRVKVPKVGWITADPIMPEKWFGWTPPYPNAKYWPASSDELDQLVDTSPSLRVDGPGMQPQPAFDLGISGLRGMGNLGHGGGHGHGGRGRGERWGGGGYGPGYGWDNGFDEPNIYVLPVIVDGRVPTPNLVSLVPDEDTSVQAMENPMLDYSAGMGQMSGFFDDALKPFNTAIDAITAVPNAVINYVTGSDLSTTEKVALAQRVINGSLAKELNDRRSRAFANSDLASKYIANAKRSGNSAALDAANGFANAARQEQYAINEAMGKYNQAADAIKTVSAGYYNPPRVGLGSPAAIFYTIAAVVGTVAVSVALVSLSNAVSKVADTVDSSLSWKKKVEDYNDAVQSGALTKTEAKSVFFGVGAPNSGGGNSNGSTWGDYLSSKFTGGKDTIFNYALIIGGTYVAWQFFRYAGGLADAKIRSKVMS